jgi:hypothetical protein
MKGGMVSGIIEMIPYEKQTDVGYRAVTGFICRDT